MMHGQSNYAMDYAVNRLDLLNIMLDIIYPSYSESEAGMGSFAISRKQLTTSRCCDLWERVGLQHTYLEISEMYPWVLTQDSTWGHRQLSMLAAAHYPQLTRGSCSPLSLGILFPSTMLRTGAMYIPVAQACVSALPHSV